MRQRKINNYKNRFLLIAFLCFGMNCGFGQFSKTHYIPPLTASSDPLSNPQDQYLYISTPNTDSFNVRITPVGATTIEQPVSNASPIVYSIGSGNNSQLVVNSTDTAGIHNNKGFIVEADDLVYVTVRLSAADSFAQAGGLVSKGLAGLGTEFRVGTFTSQNPVTDYLNFVSVMATEDNTEVTISDLSPGVIILNNTPTNITLNTNESYILALRSDAAVENRDGLIGALVSATKPIAVNCGSFNGSNDNGFGRDIGIDQIAPVERIGSEYIFVRTLGYDAIERPLIVAHEDNTDVFIDGTATPIANLNAGEYILIDGALYGTNNNLYVNTSKDVFAFQGIGGASSEANQGMFFVPPLNCQTPKIVDNIPFADNIGSRVFSGGITVVSEAGATITINGVDIITAGGVLNTITGNTAYETYTITGLTGNISVNSTNQVYVAYFGANGNASFGGFYSGFAFKPEVSQDVIDATLEGNCIPNVNLSVSSISTFDIFQWYYNGAPIAMANDRDYVPTQPGYYYVEGQILGCPDSELLSDNTPVSSCPTDIDGDGVNDNIDIDNDNDGILNCNESLGDQNLDITNSAMGFIPLTSTTFTGILATEGNVATTPLLTNTNGLVQTDLPPKTADDETSVTYTIDFSDPTTISMVYASNAISGNGLLTNDESFIVRTTTDKTITVLNEDNQLLIDTNYDGIYETGVTQYSSFEIRFKISTPSLALGSGTFIFSSYKTTSFSITHINDSLDNDNQATFRLFANCVDRDSDNDGIADALDHDSDNDTLPDIVEAWAPNDMPLSGSDTDENGLDDIFDATASPNDYDGDLVPNYLDLDSDNDGVYDLEESGSMISDSNFDGQIDDPLTVGTNGWDDNAETSADNGIMNYTILDIDNDNLYNFIDNDCDNDGCTDAIEAGYSDDNDDGFLGNGMVTVNSNGVVTSAVGGYTTPNSDYITSAPIVITDQPMAMTVCEEGDTSFTATANAIDAYQWEVSTDGVSWITIIDDINYSGTATNTLSITNIPLSFNGNLYRILLNRNGNTCGLLTDAVMLTVHPLPVVNSPVSLVQCDDDDASTIGFSPFNLTEANDEISTDASNETFTYFTSQTAAALGDTTHADYISDPTTYVNATISNDVVWARVVTSFGCVRTAEIQLSVSTTIIPSTFQRDFYECDDFLDENGNNNSNNDNRDGISSFDFSSVNAEILALIPPGQNPLPPRYYRNEADALAEINEITDISNYRNIGYPGTQQIYVRVDSDILNDCLGLGPHITLHVESLPIAHQPTTNMIACDDYNNGSFTFDTSMVESEVLNGQTLTDVSITYFNQDGSLIADTSMGNSFPNTFTTTSQTIQIIVTNNNTNDPDGPCQDETSLTFTVDDSPIINPVTITPLCDDLPDRNDGIALFDTSTLESDLLAGQSGMQITYFDSTGINPLLDSDGNTITSPFPSSFSTSNQTAMVSITNPLNTTCTIQTTIDFVVLENPTFDLAEEAVICESMLPFEVMAENPSGIYTYEWMDHLGNVAGTNQTLVITDPSNIPLNGAIFSVTATDPVNGCTETKEINLLRSPIFMLTQDDLITVMFNRPRNSILISDQNLDVENYEFALENDSEFYPYQSQPFFTNLIGGQYTLYIRDLFNCNEISLTVYLLDAPRFFTPNGDGYYDFWQLTGLDASNRDAISTITIFDRYGKVLSQIDVNSQGWDGTYGGTPLPATDYWYSFNYRNSQGKTEEIKGHFSIIRK